MSYIERISFHQNRRDEVPNQVLAKELAEKNDIEGIQEMAGYLFDKNQSIASDCLKVMYEASYIRPELIVDYYGDFIKLLNAKNNRMVWGAMIAIASIAKVVPEMVYGHIDLIRDKAMTGSVITNIHGVYAMINMAGASEKIYNDIIDELFEIVDQTRPIDFPKRCEALFAILQDRDKPRLIEIITKNKDRLTGAGNKRVDKIIKKI